MKKFQLDNEANVANNREINVPNIGKSSEVYKNNVSVEASNNILTT